MATRKLSGVAEIDSPIEALWMAKVRNPTAFASAFWNVSAAMNLLRHEPPHSIAVLYLGCADCTPKCG
jgi:hypothetical protein